VVLAGHVGKSLRTVFPGQNLITHLFTRSQGRSGFPGGLEGIV
jgi:hypothetical protein